MKKFYSFLFLAVAGLLTFAASAQVKFTVKVDDPSKVVVETGYWSTRTPVELTGEETEVEANAYEYVFITAVDGYMLDKVTFGYEIANRQKSTYKTIYSRDEGGVLDITTIAEADIYTASLTVTADNPSAVNFLFAGSYRSVMLGEGENTVLFDPKNESGIMVSHTDYGKVLRSVKVNGESVSANSRKEFEANVADGDVVEIEANFPDEEYAVLFTYPENCPNLISRATVDYVEQQLPINGFMAQAGSIVRAYFDTEKYNVSSVSVNGVVQSGAKSYVEFIATEPTIVNVEAKPYEKYTITVEVDNPELMGFYRGSQYNYDVVELEAGVNVVEFTENVTYATVVKASDCYYETLTLNGVEYKGDDYGYGVSLSNLKQDDKIVISVKPIVRNKKFVYYVDDLSACTWYHQVQRADRSYVYVNDGYNEVPFYDGDNDFTIGWAGPGSSFNLYRNGEKVEPASEGGSYATVTVEDGDVLKAYTTEVPETYTINFEYVGEGAENIKVYTDYITEVADWQNGVTSFAGTPITITGALEVDEYGIRFTPDEDGNFNFILDRDYNLVIDATTGAILVGADAKANNGNVYNAQGMLIIENATAEQIKALAPGLYIINGVKRVIRK